MDTIESKLQELNGLVHAYQAKYSLEDCPSNKSGDGQVTLTSPDMWDPKQEWHCQLYYYPAGPTRRHDGTDVSPVLAIQKVIDLMKKYLVNDFICHE